MSIGEDSEQQRIMWNLSSTQARANLLAKLKATGADWRTELPDDRLSLEDDLNSLPMDLQGALIVVHTPDGWNPGRLEGLINFIHNNGGREREL